MSVIQLRPVVRLGAMAVAVGLLGALSACAPDLPPAEVSETASPTPTPTPTEEPLPVGAGAVLPFDCDDILDPATWDRVAGGAMPTEPDPTVPVEARDRTRGEEHCGWYRSDPHTNIRLSVYLRAEMRDLMIAEGWADEFADWTGELGVPESKMSCYSDSLGGHCDAQAVIGGYYLLTYFLVRGTTVDEAKRDSRELFAPAIAALQSSPAPEIWSMPEDAWPAIVDCAALDAAADVSAAAGVPGMTVSDVTGRGEDGTNPREVHAVWGETYCRWQAPDSDPDPKIVRTEFAAFSGGGWIWRDLVPNAAPGTIETVEIAGADDAALECEAVDDCHLILRFGANAAFIDGTQERVYGPGIALTRSQLIALGEELAKAVNAAL